MATELTLENNNDELTSKQKEEIIQKSIELGVISGNQSIAYMLDVYIKEYGEIKGTAAYNLLLKAKAIMVTTFLKWDSDKEIGQNIARLLGDTAFTATIIALTGGSVIIGTVVKRTAKIGSQ